MSELRRKPPTSWNRSFFKRTVFHALFSIERVPARFGYQLLDDMLLPAEWRAPRDQPPYQPPSNPFPPDPPGPRDPDDSTDSEEDDDPPRPPTRSNVELIRRNLQTSSVAGMLRDARARQLPLTPTPEVNPLRPEPTPIATPGPKPRAKPQPMQPATSSIPTRQPPGGASTADPDQKYWYRGQPPIATFTTTFHIPIPQASTHVAEPSTQFQPPLRSPEYKARPQPLLELPTSSQPTSSITLSVKPAAQPVNPQAAERAPMPTRPRSPRRSSHEILLPPKRGGQPLSFWRPQSAHPHQELVERNMEMAKARYHRPTPYPVNVLHPGPRPRSPISPQPPRITQSEVIPVEPRPFPTQPPTTTTTTTGTLSQLTSAERLAIFRASMEAVATSAAEPQSTDIPTPSQPPPVDTQTTTPTPMPTPNPTLTTTTNLTTPTDYHHYTPVPTDSQSVAAARATIATTTPPDKVSHWNMRRWSAYMDAQDIVAHDDAVRRPDYHPSHFPTHFTSYTTSLAINRPSLSFKSEALAQAF